MSRTTMKRSRVGTRDRGREGRRSVDYLRKHSLRRLWWSSACIALKRTASNGARSTLDHRPSGRRV
jgi:hypothetical protein